MIYLDNAATSFPKPEPVYQALDRFARTSLANPGRAGHRMAMAAEKTMDDARHALNQFFQGAGGTDIAEGMEDFGDKHLKKVGFVWN